MASKKLKLSSKADIPFKAENRLRRQLLHIKRKRALDSKRRDERFRRRREEDKKPELREERLRRNVPQTLDTKRVWDEYLNDDEKILGVAVDVGQSKRCKVDDETVVGNASYNGSDVEDRQELNGSEREEHDSIFDSPDEASPSPSIQKAGAPRQPVSASSGISMPSVPSVEALFARFPTLYNLPTDYVPKTLLTTSLHSTLHQQAHLLTTLLPYSVYIPRSASSHSHNFSVREISTFASNRKFTSVVILEEDQKRPCGLTVVHLPTGPTFHFSMTNWIEGNRIPGYGRPTNHMPELIMNNFRTPLGIITEKLFRTLFPVQPEVAGRQAVTLHNQRDYIFVRRHRYIFREKRETEKPLIGANGKEFEGGVRAGLQELGPRFTLKLRRVDKGIQRASGQEWEWKGRREKVRTRFQM